MLVGAATVGRWATQPFRFGVLLSGRGRGSNMAALARAAQAGEIPGSLVLVVSTNPQAPALARAAELGLPTRVIPAEGETLCALDDALAGAFQDAGATAVCLAGYMRLLGPRFLERFPNAVLNIHPSLLPAFGGQGMYGRRVHEAVLASGVRVTGVTVHFVDAEYDHGPIIMQRTVPVYDEDTVDTLAARVLEVENRTYPEAVRLLAAGKLRVAGRRVLVTP